MFYTMFFRDEQGNEVKLADLIASDVIHSTVFLCPRDGALTGVQAEILRDAFEKAGVYAIVCNQSVQLYQVKEVA